MKRLIIIVLSLGLVACQAVYHPACSVKKNIIYFKIKRANDSPLIFCLNQDDIVSIKTITNASGDKALEVKLTNSAGGKLHMFSSKNIGSRVSLYYHNKFISQTTIQSTLGINMLIML